MLHNHLQELRKQKGLSQEQVAQEFNVSRQTISKWELGETTPDLQKLTMISQFYHVSIDYLLDVMPIDNDLPVKSSSTSGFFQEQWEKHGYKVGYLVSIYGAGMFLSTQIFLAIANSMTNSFDSFSNGFTFSTSLMDSSLSASSISSPIMMVVQGFSFLGVVVFISGIILAQYLKKRIK